MEAIEEVVVTVRIRPDIDLELAWQIRLVHYGPVDAPLERMAKVVHVPFYGNSTNVGEADRFRNLRNIAMRPGHLELHAGCMAKPTVVVMPLLGCGELSIRGGYVRSHDVGIHHARLPLQLHSEMRLNAAPHPLHDHFAAFGPRQQNREIVSLAIVEQSGQMNADWIYIVQR